MEVSPEEAAQGFELGSFAYERSYLFADPAPKVFIALFNDIDRWWTHRLRDRCRSILEPQLGGRWTQEWDGGGALFGTVTVFDPPHLLRIVGQLAMSAPSHNVLDFVLEPEADDVTRLTVRHRCFGEIEPGTAKQYAEGWDDLLGRSLADWLRRKG